MSSFSVQALCAPSANEPLFIGATNLLLQNRGSNITHDLIGTLPSAGSVICTSTTSLSGSVACETAVVAVDDWKSSSNHGTQWVLSTVKPGEVLPTPILRASTAGVVVNAPFIAAGPLFGAGGRSAVLTNFCQTNTVLVSGDQSYPNPADILKDGLSQGPGTLKIAGGLAVPGMATRIELSGIVGNNASEDATLYLLLGTTEVFLFAMNLDRIGNESAYRCVMDFTVHAVGTVAQGGKLAASCMFFYINNSNLLQGQGINRESLSIDTTAAMDINIKVLFASASAANRMSISQCRTSLLNYPA